MTPDLLGPRLLINGQEVEVDSLKIVAAPDVPPIELRGTYSAEVKLEAATLDGLKAAVQELRDLPPPVVRVRLYTFAVPKGASMGAGVKLGWCVDNGGFPISPRVLVGIGRLVGLYAGPVRNPESAVARIRRVSRALLLMWPTIAAGTPFGLLVLREEGHVPMSARDRGILRRTLARMERER